MPNRFRPLRPHGDNGRVPTEKTTGDVRNRLEVVPLDEPVKPALTRALPVLGTRPVAASDFDNGRPAASPPVTPKVRAVLSSVVAPRAGSQLEAPPRVDAAADVPTLAPIVVDPAPKVPVIEPTPPAAPEAPSDRRRMQLAGRRVLRTGPTTLSRLACPSCHQPARVDIADVFNGTLYLICDACERMWQDRARIEAPLDPSSAMRD